MIRVYIATSLDGFIAADNDDLGWLDDLPPTEEGEDYGYAALMRVTDALLMGRRTFDVIGEFRPWPYDKPVFVASSTMTAADIPDDLATRVIPIAGTPGEMVAELDRRGHHSLYLDGGSLITSFLAEDLIDELAISVMPVLLGSGIRLFGHLRDLQWWEHITTDSYPSGMVQSTYRRKKS